MRWIAEDYPKFEHLAPVIQRVDSTLRSTNQYLADKCYLSYPVDTAIHPFNNWDLGLGKHVNNIER